jgi:hypothetical protein
MNKPHTLKIDEQRYTFHQLKIILLINIIYFNIYSLSYYFTRRFVKRKLKSKSLTLFKDFLKKIILLRDLMISMRLLKCMSQI